MPTDAIQHLAWSYPNSMSVNVPSSSARAIRFQDAGTGNGCAGGNPLLASSNRVASGELV